MSSTQAELNPDEISRIQVAVWGYRQGELVALMMHLGHRLGLYRALHDLGSATPADLADATGLNERWLREWLLSQAAAKIIDSDDGKTFVFSDEAAAVLVDEGALTYAGSALGGPTPPAIVDAVAESFRTGIGLSYDDHGASEAAHVDMAFAAWTDHVIVPQFVPAVAGLAERLEAGATVVDVGCGAGRALRNLAEAYPNGRYFGLDVSQHAIDLAKETVGDLPITFEAAGSERLSAIAAEAGVDVVLTLDCLHDMTRPHDVAADIAGSLADDGYWLIKEIRSGGSLEANRKNPMLALLYSTSVMVCMSSALSEPGGAGYGTVGLHPDALTELVNGVGFSNVERFDFGDVMNLYYSVTR